MKTTHTKKFKIALSIIALITLHHAAFSQWTKTGTDIYYNDSKVGIGTKTPETPLQLIGDMILGNEELGQRFILHPRSGDVKKGDFFQITSDDASGNWEWSKGITFMRNTGHVGIGTITPIHTLDVNGVIHNGGPDFILGRYDGRFQGTLKQNRALVHDDFASGKDYLVINYNGDFEDGVNIAGPKTVFDGNIGIATSTPLARLSIGNGTINDGAVPLQMSTGGPGSLAYIGVNKDGKYGLLLGYENAMTYTGAVIRNVSADPLHFVVNNTLEAMRILPNGNIGIGTTNPSAKLSVFESNKGLEFTPYYAPLNGSVMEAIDRNSFDPVDFNLYLANGKSKIKFFTSALERMRINELGNVGIATTDPKDLLVVGDAYAFHSGGNKVICIGYSAGSGKSLYNGYVGEMRLDPVNGRLTFGVSSKSYLKGESIGLPYSMIIDKTGNIGIGTTSPTKTLDVFGDAKIGQLGNRHYLKIASSEFPEIRFQTPTDDEIIRIGVATYNNGYHKVGDLYFYSALTGRTDLILPKTGGVIMAPGGGNVGIGTTNPENREGWEKVVEIAGNTNSKLLVSSSGIKSGLWSHSLGFYGAPAGGIVGTWTNHPFSIITNSTSRLTINTNGQVIIGNASVTTPGNYKLYVEGGILTERVKAAVKTSANWSDYVFASDYNLMPLTEVESFIKEKKHLPGVPSADDVVKNGIDMAAMDATILSKVEELTLYVIELKKEIEALKKENAKLNASSSKN